MKSLGQRVHAYKRCFVSGPGACPPKTQTRPLSASPSAPQTTADPITTASSSCPRVSCTENHAGSFVVWAPSAQRHRESHLQSHMSVVHASLLLSRLRRVPVSHWFFLFFVFVFVFLAIRNTAALDVCRSQYCDYGLSFLLPRYLGAESLGRGAGRTPRAPVRSSYDVVVPLTSDPWERLASPAALI